MWLWLEHTTVFINQVLLPVLFLWSLFALGYILWVNKAKVKTAHQNLFLRYYSGQLLIVLLPVSLLLMALNYAGLNVQMLVSNFGLEEGSAYVLLPEVWVSATFFDQHTYQLGMLESVVFFAPSVVILGAMMWGGLRFMVTFMSLIHQKAHISFLSSSEWPDACRLKAQAIPNLRIATTDTEPSPYTIGWLKPIIVLPSNMLTKPEALIMALEHEARHIAQKDYLLHLINELICSVFYVNPLVRIIARYIHDDRERLCDLWVLSSGKIDPVAYAELLLDIGKRNQKRLMLSMGGRSSSLKERVEQIVESVHFLPLEIRETRIKLNSVSICALLAISIFVQPTRPSQSLALADLMPAVQQPFNQSPEIFTTDQKQADLSEDEVFMVVESPPELKGGLEQVAATVVYPEQAKQHHIEGRVFVQFVVEKDGKVSQPVVVRGIGYGCDESALAAVSKAEFTPGMQRGQPVRVRYSLPIVFRLK